jgi:hypothetical protein
MAMSLMDSKKHLSLIEMRYELDLSDEQLQAVVIFLEARFHYAHSFAGCQIHQVECLIHPELAAEFPKPLLGQPTNYKGGKLSMAVEIFREMEGSEKKPIELAIFVAELDRSLAWESDEELDKLIQKLIKEGIIWENKPGFYRRVSA